MARRKEYGPSEGQRMIHGLAEAAHQIAREERQRKSLDLDLVFPLLEPKVGDTAVVKMYDGKTIEGRVAQVSDTISGKKVRVVSGALVVTVDIEQILDIR